MKKINKDVLIGDLLKIDPAIALYLMDSGMHCVGCPSSQGESLELACAVHGITSDELDELVEKINNHLEASQYE
jgi:hybrid cluster-associated redox disulfide protein